MATVVFDENGLVAEAKKNFQSFIGRKYTEADVKKTWNGIFNVIKDSLKQQRGVQLIGLGTFTFNQVQIDIGNKTLLTTRQPVFRLSHKLTHMYKIQSCELFKDVDLTPYPLNLVTVASSLGMDRHVVECCVTEVLSALARHLSQGRDIDFLIPGMCKIQIRGKKEKTKFFSHFENQLPIYKCDKEHHSKPKVQPHKFPSNPTSLTTLKNIKTPKKKVTRKSSETKARKTNGISGSCDSSAYMALEHHESKSEEKMEKESTAGCYMNTCTSLEYPEKHAGGDAVSASASEVISCHQEEPSSVETVAHASEAQTKQLGFSRKGQTCEVGDDDEEDLPMEAMFPGSNHPPSLYPPDKQCLFTESTMRPMKTECDVAHALADCNDLIGRRLCPQCVLRMKKNLKSGWAQEHSKKCHKEVEEFHNEPYPLLQDFAAEWKVRQRKINEDYSKFNYELGLKEREARMKKVEFHPSDIFHDRPPTVPRRENEMFQKNQKDLMSQIKEKHDQRMKKAEEMLVQEKEERERVLAKLKKELEEKRQEELEAKEIYTKYLLEQMKTNREEKEAERQAEIACPGDASLDPHMLFQKSLEDDFVVWKKDAAIKNQKLNLESVAEITRKAKEDYEKKVKEETAALERAKERMKEVAKYQCQMNHMLLNEMKAQWKLLEEQKKVKPVEGPTISLMDQLYYYNRCYRCKKRLENEGETCIWKSSFCLDGHSYIM